jgi:hypothetical protein
MGWVADSGAFSDAEGSMGSVSPKMEGTPLDEVPVDDEENMTSVMSYDQRKALQKAAKTENESATLERDTARPPPSQEEAVSIPRAAPVPAEVRTAEAPRVEPTPATPAKPGPAAPSAKPAPSVGAPARDAEAKSGWVRWALLAFVLLAASIAIALRL